MKLEDLKIELDKDLYIDQTKMMLESANNPLLYSKWAGRMADTRREILRLDAKRKTVAKDKLDYYTGRSTEVCLDRYERSEMKTVFGADKELLDIDTKISLLGIRLDFISHAMDAIKSRAFSIKYIIELRQFEEGK